MGMRETKLDMEATSWAVLFPFEDQMVLDTSTGTTSSHAVPAYPWEGLCRRKKKSRQEKYFRVLKGVPHQQVTGEWKSEQGGRLGCLHCASWGFPGGSDNKKPACNAGDSGSILGQEHPLEEGMATQIQYPCLENPMDRGAWRATVRGVAKGQTRRITWHFTFMVHLRNPEQEFHKKTETDSQT